MEGGLSLEHLLDMPLRKLQIVSDAVDEVVKAKNK